MYWSDVYYTWIRPRSGEISQIWFSTLQYRILVRIAGNQDLLNFLHRCLPLVMWSPRTQTQLFSTNSLPANQMHPDSKVANHGKQVTNDSRSQIPGINQQQHQQQQGTTGHLAPKNVSAGSHGVKANQISSCNPGLKISSQSASSVGGMLKTKSKRERSITADSGETRNAIPPAVETEAKGGKTCMHRRNLYQQQGHTDRLYLL